MKSILVDAGPLIASFDKDDKYHMPVLNFLKNYTGRLITTWPVITETTHLLSFNIKTQLDFLEFIKRGGLTIFPLDHTHVERIIQLSKKYSDIPIDLADCSLIVIAEITGIADILTIDSDYYIYRIKNKKYFNNVLAEYLQKRK